MSAADIAAVVVTHDSATTIDACLSRLRVAEGVGWVRVVDNGSRDDTVAVVQRHAAADPRVHFIANPDNPGFAVACNQGAEDVDAATTWLAFVNPDCMVQPDSLARMRAHARELGDNELGDDPLGGSMLLGADLVGEDGVHDGAARRRDPDFAAMLRSLSATRLDLARDPACVVQRVDAVSGALMLLPRIVFVGVGGFDPGYRLHAEDLDLCRRVRGAGGVVAVANDVTVLHVRGVSSRARPFFVEWHKHRGLWRYFRKFEADRRDPLTRAAVWLAIWAHWAIRLPAGLL